MHDNLIEYTTVYFKAVQVYLVMSSSNLYSFPLKKSSEWNLSLDTDVQMW